MAALASSQLLLCALCSARLNAFTVEVQVQRKRAQTACAVREQQQAEVKQDIAALTAFDAALNVQLLRELGSGDFSASAAKR